MYCWLSWWVWGQCWCWEWPLVSVLVCWCWNGCWCPWSLVYCPFWWWWRSGSLWSEWVGGVGMLRAESVLESAWWGTCVCCRSGIHVRSDNDWVVFGLRVLIQLDTWYWYDTWNSFFARFPRTQLRVHARPTTESHWMSTCTNAYVHKLIFSLDLPSFVSQLMKMSSTYIIIIIIDFIELYMGNNTK